MRFADDLFQRYLRHFSDSDSGSLDLFIQSILEQMDHDDLLEVFESCTKSDLNNILSSYLSDIMIEKLRDTNSNAVS
ncbi:DUF6154 family protein [Aquibacillus koreensis]|uniref:DUF6154 family protein n=1 Tax=Aquibacillus koreensis TaxID=279446 RepID=A0A9X3WKG9_9BACI|nr:DUF6154 family protein [Aquibacillus koreensis]MCT2535844.1 DUF6154 family protein [Aquibacillus koreensis]MDC3420300.1 DUF6154 family protein [Aquibacillus koreensis]